MIRVAYFAPLLTTGGTQRHLQQVLSLLDPSRFDAHVRTLRPGGDVEVELRRSGVRVVPLAVGNRLVSPRALASMLTTARALRREAVEVVHGYQWRPALVGSIVARLAGVPLVLASKRSLTGEHERARRAWRVIARRVDTILVNAEALRGEGETQGMRGRWELIPSGVDVDRFGGGRSAAEAKSELGLDPMRAVVGTVGRLEERKGHDLFLHGAREMLARANGMRPQILIVGDGPLRARLTAQAAELDIAESVRFTGAVPDVRPALCAMDVFVLPSNAEGMSNALLEAMAARRPVVATDVGGTSEVINGDGSGTLVPPGDPQALAGAIMALLADPARAGRVGETARQRVVERFSARAMVTRLEALYEERLAVRGRRP
jgi:glycosyltransferase involved in cell wall biosynthesis